MKVALKEWASLCELLLQGKIAFTIRKGGIHELHGPGQFHMEHNSFYLFPSWLHQKVDKLKIKTNIEPENIEPDKIMIKGMARVHKIWRIENKEWLDHLNDFIPFTKEYAEMRWDYKPKNPLYLILLNVQKIEIPFEIPNNQGYKGCRSWVNLLNEDLPESTTYQAVHLQSELEQLNQKVDRVINTLSN